MILNHGFEDNSGDVKEYFTSLIYELKNPINYCIQIQTNTKVQSKQINFEIVHNIISDILVRAYLSKVQWNNGFFFV